MGAGLGRCVPSPFRSCARVAVAVAPLRRRAALLAPPAGSPLLAACFPRRCALAPLVRAASRRGLPFGSRVAMATPRPLRRSAGAGRLPAGGRIARKAGAVVARRAPQRGIGGPRAAARASLAPARLPAARGFPLRGSSRCAGLPSLSLGPPMKFFHRCYFSRFCEAST